ncbi:hypothetical protein N0V95_005100 [Ascochyta clinopodiicola]|nr:hypothetical protein N0V95_005100 [Ascochyta clinopodiicola]
MTDYDILARAQNCREQFELLLKIKEEVGVSDEAENNSHDVTWIRDQFARFKMLRDSDETKRFLLDFLASLGDFIHTALDSLVFTERTDSPLEEDPSDDAALFGTSIPSTVSSSFQGTETESLQNALSAAATFGTTLERRKLQGVEKAIDRLYRLSLIIRQPSRESQNERAGRLILRDEDGNDIDESFARYAADIVDHKFPKAPVFLRQKLAYGIIVRRKRFWYRQNHQRKLSGATTQLDVDANTKNADGDTTEKPDSTVRYPF